LINFPVNFLRCPVESSKTQRAIVLHQVNLLALQRRSTERECLLT
uniref:LysR family transcriptional regulator n=1 Tax=Ascaris lumbricoides TaxID=6252 RepID=A0A0M3IWT4_ASCLU